MRSRGNDGDDDEDKEVVDGDEDDSIDDDDEEDRATMESMKLCRDEDVDEPFDAVPSSHSYPSTTISALPP